ncbi:hypothetical protein AGR13a_Lc90086 [Agrobacterium genomosp. 13 str. CFBP 6927]|uniref:Transposase n=1 Tax=Agrobacterium genomosp. 13 str. CFBP 6927 TaxID=1183428 RepID=A0ABP2BPC4_9HYPH|nr:hypothetical protein AGR13a_Lc90086 [Agrobacterium genomosp. 13 str. CFBP 6927]
MSLYPFSLHADLVDHSEELCVGVCPKMAHHHVSEFVAHIVNVDGHRLALPPCGCCGEHCPVNFQSLHPRISVFQNNHSAR